MGLDTAYMCNGTQANQSYISGMSMVLYMVCPSVGMEAATDETTCNAAPYCIWTGPTPAAGSYQQLYG